LITPGRNARHRFTSRNGAFHRLVLCTALFMATEGILAATRVNSADTITWVQFRAVLMRVDDESPKEWNLWRDAHSKKDDILLMQWNKRYLRINAKLQEVREIDPQTVVHKDKSVTSPADVSSAKLLPTDGWILRDVGTADRIYFELTAEDHRVDINIPHGGR
jgi:hypothetical protein